MYKRQGLSGSSAGREGLGAEAMSASVLRAREIMASTSSSCGLVNREASCFTSVSYTHLLDEIDSRSLS